MQQGCVTVCWFRELEREVEGKEKNMMQAQDERASQIEKVL